MRHPQRRPWALLAGPGLALLLSACASMAPPAEPASAPIDLPAAFAAVASGPTQEASERWWQDFGDDSLDNFVDAALQRSPALGQAIARVRIAEAQARIQRAGQLPQVGVGLNSSRQRQGLMGMGMATQPGPAGSAGEGGGAGHVTLGTHALGLDISWELDLWGRLSALSDAARAEFLAASEQLRAARQSIVAEVVRLYFGVVQAQAQLALSERTVRALAEMARQIDNRARAGITSPADSLLASANLASARAGLAQRQESLARTVRELEALMGDYPSGRLEAVAVLPDVQALPAPGIPAELLARRPDVRAADAMLQSAGYRLGAAQRSFLPSVSLSGSAGTAGSELADLFRSGSFVWSIAGSILQPVFQGGRLRAQVGLAEGQRDEAVHGYAETVLTALSEVETALAVDVLLADRETALDLSANAAEEAVRVSLNRYRQGIDPFLNVLESQQRALDGRSAQLGARHARLENRVALHLALGGGFDNVPASAMASRKAER